MSAHWFLTTCCKRLVRTWFGKSPRPIRRPGQRKPRPQTLLNLETLEDRTLLTAPAPYVITPSVSGVGQFNNGSGTLSVSNFLGGNFNVGASVGGIDHTIVGDYGAEASLNMSGNVGLAVGASVTSGTVGASYNSVTLNQNYTEPTQFNQEVNFTPQNTSVGFAGGQFATTAPSANVYANFDASVNGSLSGTVAFVNDYTSTTNFSGSLNQSLFNMTIGPNDENQMGLTDLSILGVDLSGLVNAVVQGQSFDDLGPDGEGVSVSEDPPLKIKGLITGASDPFQIKQGFELAEGIGGEDSGIDASVDLGSVGLYVPDPVLSSSAQQSDGVLTDTQHGKIADVSLQMGALVGSLFGLGALADTDTIQIGNMKLSLTPVSFEMGPALVLEQTGTITPTNSLTYNFYNASGNATTTVDVVKDGVDLGSVPSVTFTPGQDTISLDFTGTPFTVKPTWNASLNYTNQVDLAVDLEGELTVGKLTGTIDGVGSITLGPIYKQEFDFASWPIDTLYDNTFSIYQQSYTLPSFEVGSTFQLSTQVTSTSDSNTEGSGSLRFAVNSANTLAQGSAGSNLQTIVLGAGTYNLMSSVSPSSLTVNSGTNLLIVGAGAGQTSIDASTLHNSVFNVASGGTLTLEDVTIKGGSAAQGGGIDNAGDLTIEDSTLTGNTAQGTSSSHTGEGGAIYNAGTLEVENSTLSNNDAQGYSGFQNGAGEGGAIYNAGTLTLMNNTLSGNTAAGATGNAGIDEHGTAENGGAGNNGLGGGLYQASGRR